MSGNDSHFARPVLDGLDVVTVVQDELVLLFDEGSCGHKGGDVGAMPHLSLSIAAQNFIVSAFFEVFLLLVVSPHDLDALDEHPHVHGAGRLVHGVQHQICHVCLTQFRVQSVVDNRQIPHRLLEDLDPALVIDVKIIGGGFISVEDSPQFLVLLLAVEEL